MRLDKIKELYENQIDTINVEYEIIDVVNANVIEIADIISRTNEQDIRHDIANYLMAEEKNIYIIEDQDYRGALYVSSNYDEVLKEWFRLNYLKEQEQ